MFPVYAHEMDGAVARHFRRSCQTLLQELDETLFEPVEVAVEGAAESGPSALRSALRALGMTHSIAWIEGPLFALFGGSWFSGGSTSSAQSKVPVGAK